MSNFCVLFSPSCRISRLTRNAIFRALNTTKHETLRWIFKRFSFSFLLFCGSWIMMQSFKREWDGMSNNDISSSTTVSCVYSTQHILAHTFWSFGFIYFIQFFFGIHSSKLRCFMACLLECRKKIKRLKSWKKTTERMMRWEWREGGSLATSDLTAWRYFFFSLLESTRLELLLETLFYCWLLLAYYIYIFFLLESPEWKWVREKKI